MDDLSRTIDDQGPNDEAPLRQLMGGPRSVREISDVDARIFNEEILPLYEPVVMRGLVDEWPIVKAAAIPEEAVAYLARFGQNNPIETFIGEPAIKGRFFYRDDLRSMNFIKRKLPLGSVLQELLRLKGKSDAPALYAGAASTPQHLPGFAAENSMPLLPATIAPRIWTGNAVTISTHYDLSANVACVAAGRRRFTLFPPSQVANLYVGPLEHTIAGQPVSMVDIEEPDLERFPRFAEARAESMTTELEPGDAIYIPTLWWHQVQSLGDFNVLVNYWWSQGKDGSPFECLIHALLTIRDLPTPERQAWRSIFEHYVFGPDAASAGSHLPTNAQGILGPNSSERSRTIKQFLLGCFVRN